MTTTPPFDVLLSAIGARTAALVSALTVAPGMLDLAVPDCPEWTGRELAVHLRGVHGFWAHAARLGTTEEPTEPETEPTPADAGLGAWLMAGAADLVEALAAAGPDAPCWTWWGEPQTVAAVARHQVVEVAVHAYDAAALAGTATTDGWFGPELAVDVVDEFLTVIQGAQQLYPSCAWPHGAIQVALVVPDAPGWVVDLGPGLHHARRGTAENPDLVLSGTAGALALALHRRAPGKASVAMSDVAAGEQFLDWPDLS